jgi:hypothetical protein
VAPVAAGALVAAISTTVVLALERGAGFPLAAIGTLKLRADGIPNFSAAGYGWFEDGDDFLPPESGSGPVFSDPKHPYFSNQSGVLPTYRVTDLSNVILKPWVKDAQKKANDRALSGNVPFNPQERCWPAGVPAFEVYTRVRPVYFVQGAKDVLIVNEGDAQVRHVYLDVPHSKTSKPSWYGDSVGHYEANDTLVIDTIGISDNTFVDNYLTSHTDQLHVVERFTLGSDGRTLNVTVIVDDPGAFTTPWSARQVYHLEFQGPWDESPCADNNTNYFGFDVSPLPTAAKPDFRTTARCLRGDGCVSRSFGWQPARPKMQSL